MGTQVCSSPPRCLVISPPPNWESRIIKQSNTRSLMVVVIAYKNGEGFAEGT